MTIRDTTAAAIADSRPIDLPTPADRRTLRRRVGLTQARVGEVVGVSAQMVGFWESGRNEPTGDRRSRYAELLKACAESDQR